MQAAISAIQNAYHPCVIPTVFMKNQRHGTNIPTRQQLKRFRIILPQICCQQYCKVTVQVVTALKELPLCIAKGVLAYLPVYFLCSCDLLRLEKNKREICEDKLLLMISRFKSRLRFLYYMHIIMYCHKKMQEKFYLILYFVQ